MNRHPNNPALNLSNTASHLKTNTKAENNTPLLGKSSGKRQKKLLMLKQNTMQNLDQFYLFIHISYLSAGLDDRHECMSSELIVNAPKTKQTGRSTTRAGLKTEPVLLLFD